MPRYVVSGLVTISVHVEVEANSEDEARAAADEAPMLTLCNGCSTGEDDVWSTSGELDGLPTIQEVRLRERAKRGGGS